MDKTKTYEHAIPRLVLSLYAIIITAGLCTLWLSRHRHSTGARRLLPFVASIATAIAWETFYGALSICGVGPYTSHFRSYGFAHEAVVLLPVLRVVFTAILSLPAALAVTAFLRNENV